MNSKSNIADGELETRVYAEYGPNEKEQLILTIKNRIEGIPEGKIAIYEDGAIKIVDKPKDVTERIKTFDDARNELGQDHPLVKAYETTHTSDVSVSAFMKLRIISAALNEGWKPTLAVTENRYYPYFYFYSQKEIDGMCESDKKNALLWGGNSNGGSGCCLACAVAGNAWSGADAGFSARLVYKNKEIAIYAGKQFLDVYKDYLLD